MNFCCENCGWSEVVGPLIMCNYDDLGTRRDECCMAWKPKGKETNMVEVVRCRDCKYVCLCDVTEMIPDIPVYAKCTLTDDVHEPDWFCADGRKVGEV